MTGLAIIHTSYDPEEILVMRSHLDAHNIPNCGGTSFRSMRFKWISFILLWSSLTTGTATIPFVPDSRYKRCLQCYQTVKSGYKKRHWPFLFVFAFFVFLVPLAMSLIVWLYP